MKKLLLSTAILLVTVSGHAQENPFAEYGYTPKIATLSQGQFYEFFDNDTIVQIGSVLFNTKSKQIVAFIEYDTMYSEATLEPDIVSRWMSPDPLASDYPGESPYSFAGNSPIVFVDQEGKFKIPIHYSITKQALAGLSLSNAASIDILNGNTIVADIMGANSEIHFDARRNYSQIQSTFRTLNEKIDDLANNYTKLDAFQGGSNSIELGKALHTVQDFYAHSNYVELYIQYYQDNNDGAVPDAENIPIYDKGIQDENFANNYLKGKLKTGEFNLLRYLNPFKSDVGETNAEGDVHHDDIAKDSEEMGRTINGTNGSVNTFDAARAVATRHTKKVAKKVAKGKGG